MTFTFSVFRGRSVSIKPYCCLKLDDRQLLACACRSDQEWFLSYVWVMNGGKVHKSNNCLE